MIAIVKSYVLKSHPAHVPHGGRASGGNDVIAGLRLLQHQPHCLDIIACETPVAFRIDIAEPQLILPAELDPRHGVGHLARDELDAAQRRFVIEQDAGRSMHCVAFAVVDRAPMREKLGHAIGTAWMEGRVLVLLLVLDQPKHFAGRRLIEPDCRIPGAYRLEHVQRADTGDLRREHRLLPRRRDEALRGKVVNLVDRRALHDALDR